MSGKGASHTLPSCPCGSEDTYPRCCGVLHEGGIAQSAEALMRARYSAYVLKREDYLLATWHADTRPASLALAGEQTRWLGLEVREHRMTAPDAAVVEFVARYRIGGGAVVRMVERSCFLREHGRWYYVDGEHSHPR